MWWSLVSVLLLSTIMGFVAAYKSRSIDFGLLVWASGVISGGIVWYYMWVG